MKAATAPAITKTLSESPRQQGDGPNLDPHPISKGATALNCHHEGPETDPNPAPAAIHIRHRYEHSRSFYFLMMAWIRAGVYGTQLRTQNPEAGFIDGATLAAFESALGFYAMDEQGFIRLMIVRLIHHHQSFTELVSFAIKS
jgi:hypothetical protein